MASASLDNDIVRRGYLNVVRNPKDGVIGTLTSGMTTRRYWVVLRKETPRCDQLSRLQLYRDEFQASVAPSREIILDSIKMIHHADQRRKKAFEVQLASESLMFLCGSHADVDDWIGDIRRFRDSLRSSSFSASFPDNSLGQQLYEEIEEPPDIVYDIELRRSSTIRFHGRCRLRIDKDFDRNCFHITIITRDDERLIVKWQIDHIRQYGSNQGAFKFQSGSKSSTGVDWFIVDTEPGDAPRIHRAVDYWAKHIVDQVHNTKGGSLPTRSSSVNSNGSRSFSPTSPVSPSAKGVYQALNPRTRTGQGVYDSPFQANGSLGKASKAVPRSQGSIPIPPRGSQGSPARPPRTEKAVYQELNTASMDRPSHSTYESLTAHTRDGSREPPAVSRQPSSPRGGVYQDLSPHTMTHPEPSEYMGLKKTDKS